MVAARPTSAQTPLVSCILPTKNRARFISQAIRSYQSQTYPNKELIIVDNGDDSTHSLIPDDPSIHYTHVTNTYNTGDMRNLCAKRAQGEFIVHFDSDDWSAPERVTDQVTRLGTFGVVTGYHSMLFYDERTGHCYFWQLTHGSVVYVLGTSLCYRRAWWQHHPFESMQIGEDIRFYKQALREAHRLVSSYAGREYMVARVHSQQTCQKSLTSPSYQTVPSQMLPKAFPCDSTSLVT
jgi:glycosyltransferase involved in cell wall biosynthesis